MNELGRLTPALFFGVHFIHFVSLMAFTAPRLADTDSTGAMSDGLTQNALTAVGAAGLAGVGVMSVAVTATVLPAQTICLAGAATAALVAGKRQAEGKSILPSFGSDKQKDSATTPAAAEAAA